MPQFIIPAVATIGGALLSKSASDKSTKAAENTARETNAMNERLARENRDFLASRIDPIARYAEPGMAALARRSGITGGGSTGGSVFPSQPSANSNNIFARGPSGPLASGPNGVPTVAGGDMQPPGPAPAGQRWVHGPEGWALMQDTGGGSFRDSMSRMRSTGKPQGGGAQAMGGGGQVIDYAMSGHDGDGAGASASGGPDWQAYMRDNPDLNAQTWYDQHRGEWGDVTGDGAVDDQDSAAMHYRLHGQGEGRALANMPGQPVAQPDPDAPYTPYGLDGFDQAAPEAGPRTDARRPDAIAAPTYNRPDQPQWQDVGPAPAWDQYFDGQNLEVDPSYQFRLNEGLRAGQNSFAGRGMLRSGAAAKALTGYASNLASTEFSNIFGRAMSRYSTDLNQYNTNRGQSFNIFANNRDAASRNFESDRATGLDVWDRLQNRSDRNYELDTTRADARYDSDRAWNRSVYEGDRGFAADRFDRQTGDIYNTTALGTGAINSLAGVGTNYVNAATAANTSAGTAAANAALARGANTANIFAGAAGAIGNIFGSYGGNPFAKPPAAGTGAAGTGYGTPPIMPDYSKMVSIPPRVF